MPQTRHAHLLAIVEVDQASRVQCQQPGCGHTVWKAVHVVLEDEATMVLGSTCFAKRYGGLNALGAAAYGPGSSRKLTDQERLLLQNNTRELLALFEAERSQRTKPVAAPRAHWGASPAQRPATSIPRSGPRPWMKPVTSMAYFKLSDGSGWVRVQRRDGQQMLVPLPAFDGWDEALPKLVGVADLDYEAYCIFDIARAIAYLRERSTKELISGVWAEIQMVAYKQ